MDFFNQVADGITNAGVLVGQKAKDITDTTKLSYDVHTLDTKIKAKYTEIGKKMFEAESKGEEAPDPTDIYNELKELITERADLQEQIKTIKGVEICPHCGKELPKDSTYCNSCGEKLV